MAIMIRAKTGVFLLAGILVQPITVYAQRPHGPGFRPVPPQRPLVINNNYSNNNNAGLDFLSGVVGFGAGLAVGNAVKQPRIPQSSVYVTQPAPAVVVTQPFAPSVVVAQPAPVVTAIAPQPADVLGDSLRLLNSHWPSKRREAATKLGRIRASSASGPLMDSLRNDKDDGVRKAAAWALAEIGESTALDYLEKAAQFDRSPEVRAAARTASQKLIEKVAIRTPVEPTTRVDVSRSIRQSPNFSSPPRPGTSVPTTSELKKMQSPIIPKSSSPFGTPSRPSIDLPALSPPN